jgi:hypothetical protein
MILTSAAKKEKLCAPKNQKRHGLRRSHGFLRIFLKSVDLVKSMAFLFALEAISRPQ